MKKLPKSTKEHRSKAVQIKSAVPHETCDELCNSSSPKYNDSIQAGMKSNVILDNEMFKLFVNDREVMYDICELKIYGSFNVRVAWQM